MKIKEILSKNNDIFFETEILIKFLLNKDFIDRSQELSNEQYEILNSYIQELRNGKPLQYITHYQYFYDSKFYVDENVLIPQPDTEKLIEIVFNELINRSKKCKILDLCTGSGAIAITIEKHFSDFEIFASDISPKAIDVAKKNELNILNSKKIKFIESNMFENINEKFDIIVSNPPYIKSEDIYNLPKDVQKEPNIALDGGTDGLKFYRIIHDNMNFLNDNGKIFLEIGFDQCEDVQGIFKNSICYKDYSGNNRVVKINKN